MVRDLGQTRFVREVEKTFQGHQKPEGPIRRPERGGVNGSR
jgi:hypothetical protein